MADRTDSYPESATHGGRKAASADEGKAEAEGEGGTEGKAEAKGKGEAALREALDERGEDLAAAVEATDELSDVLATAVLVVASADEDEIAHVTESTANLLQAADGLSTEETAALARQVGTNADDLATVLETLLAVEREGHLDELVGLARQLSALEVEPEAVAGANTFLAAVADAERDAEPVGLLGALRELRTADARAGLGYLVAILKAQGRRVRD